MTPQRIQRKRTRGWRLPAGAACVTRLGGHPLEVIPAELGGKDLACWCALPEPGLPDLCHASIELAIANPTRED